MSSKIQWLGHEFNVYNANNTNWNDVAGVYIFCAITPQNAWLPIYVGQASSFRSRLPTHERWQEARALGANHIHAKVVPRQDDRDSLERQLIQAFQPRLNTQLK